jgi:hypothetical protein
MPTGDYEKSEWNLAIEHQKRYSLILYQMNEFSFKVNTGNYQYLTPLWASLKELWDEWRSRMRGHEDKNKIDNAFNYCLNQITNYEQDMLNDSEFKELINLIASLKQYMMDLMNRIGYGMPTEEDDEKDEDEKNSEVYNDL